jgi:CheY-like chemotaxis protein
MPNLLLVDDDLVLLTLLGKLLRRLGHRVTEANHGAAALEAVGREHFDLIITDLMMPDIDGLALIRRLRAEPHCVQTVILLVTSSLEGPDPASARAAGADAWAAKPLNYERLAALTTRLLAGARPGGQSHAVPEEL